MTSIGRRVAALEARQGGSPYDAWSDEQLAERIAELDALLVDGLREHGVDLPPGWEAMIERDRLAWMDATVRGLEG